MENKHKQYTRLKDNFGKDDAEKIFCLINYEIEPDTYDSVSDWVSQCYNEPSCAEKIMVAINEIVGGYGVEGIVELGCSYVNMGDTYTATILYDATEDEYLVTDLGTFIEQKETEQILRGREEDN